MDVRRVIGGLDFDGVISNTYPLRSVAAKNWLGREIDPILLQETRFSEAGLTRKEYQRIKELVYEKNYQAEPVDGAVESIQLLIKSGFGMRVVTARKDRDLSNGIKWAYDRRVYLPFIGVGYKKSKVQACTGLHFYVEDDPEKLIPLLGIVPHLFYFCWPWNEYEKLPGEIQKVWSWPELVDHLMHIKNLSNKILI